jgi:hypothetical protein
MILRRSLFTLAILCSLAFTASQSFAWDSTGHETVALIAYDQMSPEARTAIFTMLKNHPRLQQDLLNPDDKKFPDTDLAMFVRAATWPDIIRFPGNPMNRTEHHGPWHYVDFPFEQDGIKGPQPVTQWDGHSVPANLAQAMQKALTELKDPKTPKDRKAIDICWVEHLVGDIHQPLHAASWYSKQYPKGDQGGNQVEIRGADNLPMNLHFYWDSAEGLSMNPDDIRKTADRIEAEHPPKALADKIKDLDVVDWAHESFDLAKSAVYLNGTLAHVTSHEGLQNPSIVPPLPPGYDLRAKDVADLRIAEAGYRLAAVLEEVAKNF